MKNSNPDNRQIPAYFNFQIFIIFSLIFYSLLFSKCSPPNQDHIGWEVYSGDSKGTKYSALNQINKKNIKDLQLAWTYQTGDMREAPRTTIECNPIIVGEKMFITSPGLKVIALDAATGDELWKFDPYDGESASGVN
ncbi:MAG: PQQ-binding-like beta-propeller repeat protein, partial [Cyclobacteriaceae bacterium]|nr:PQQ-binding-like beta-propeller repeat protein [Cyclobacteriaceae bacterium]